MTRLKQIYELRKKSKRPMTYPLVSEIFKNAIMQYITSRFFNVASLSDIWCEFKISFIFVELNHWNGFPQRHLVDTKMPSVKVRSWQPCQKSSTDEQSGLNISHKKGKKMEQSDWHILAKDVNVTDWMCCLTLDLLLYSSSSFPQNLRTTLQFWSCEKKASNQL